MTSSSNNVYQFFAVQIDSRSKIVESFFPSFFCDQPARLLTYAGQKNLWLTAAIMSTKYLQCRFRAPHIKLSIHSSSTIIESCLPPFFVDKLTGSFNHGRKKPLTNVYQVFAVQSKGPPYEMLNWQQK